MSLEEKLTKPNLVKEGVSKLTGDAETNTRKVAEKVKPKAKRS